MDKKWKEKLNIEINNYLEKSKELLELLSDNSIVTFLTNAKKEFYEEKEYLNKKIQSLFETLKKYLKGEKHNRTISTSKKAKYYIQELLNEEEIYNLYKYLKVDDKKIIDNLLNALEMSSVDYCCETFCNSYPLITTILIFSNSLSFSRTTTSKHFYAEEACNPGPLYSEYCKKQYHNLMWNIQNKNNQFTNEDIFENIDYTFIIYKRKAIDNLYFSFVDHNTVNILKKEFLVSIKEFTKEKAHSLMDVIVFVLARNNKQPSKELLEYKNQYEASDEEILFLNQKYYHEQEMEYRNELLELQMQQKEEIERIERDYRERERERVKEDAVRREREEQIRNRERYERDEKQRREERENLVREQKEELYRKEQLEIQRKQARATIEARLSALRAEERLLTGPNDERRRSSLRIEIENLEREKNRM